MTEFEFGVAKYKILQKLGNDPLRAISAENWKNHHTLFTAVDGRVLAVSEHYRSVAALAGFDSIVISGFCPTNLSNLAIDLNFPCVWVRSSWTSVVQDIAFNHDDFERYALISQKALALDFLNSIYDRRTRELLIGSAIYDCKYKQAKEIIKQNIQADVSSQYAFVSGYADVAEISLEMAAKRIIFKHEDNQAKLAELENLRIRYQKLILEESDLKKIKAIVINLDTELRQYAQV